MVGVKMKTAKELCEKARNKVLTQIINQVSESVQLTVNFGITHFDYYSNCNNRSFYQDSYNFQLIENNKSKLEELGYKVEKKVYENKQFFTQKVFDKTIPESKYLWIFTIPEKQVYKNVETLKTISSFEYYTVTACCGEKDENKT